METVARTTRLAGRIMVAAVRSVWSIRHLFAGSKTLIRQALFSEYRFVEFWSGLVAVSWGIWNIFDSQNLLAIPQYHAINAIFPEPVTEAGAMMLGGFQIASVIEGKRRTRLAAAFICSWFYSFFVYSFLSAPIVPTSIVFTMGWVGVNVFAIVRLVSGAR